MRGEQSEPRGEGAGARRPGAEAYWSERLSRDFSLGGTGHQGYSHAYNRWLYRAKGRALDRGLAGLAPGSRVLDVGSGVGWVVERLVGRGMRVEGCDIAPVAVERLRARFPGIPFARVALGAQPLPAPDGAYDAVTALDVMYHLTDDALWGAALADVARVLRPGGVLILSDGLGDSDVSAAPHVRFRGRATWLSGARDAGLELERVVPYFRWLSRPPDQSRLARLPGGLRGALEYALELLAPRTPHMRCAVFVRQSDGSGSAAAGRR